MNNRHVLFRLIVHWLFVVDCCQTSIPNSPNPIPVSLRLRQNVPVRVYKCRLTARDTASGAVLFRDSIYAVLLQPEASISVLGFTGVAGTFETGDTLLFPDVMALPPLVHTDWTPDPLGTFTISDSVTITLTDTMTYKSLQFERTVKKGLNDIQLSWNPAAGVSQTTDNGAAVTHVLREKNVATVPFVWKLHQNYPNPFN